MLLLDDYFARVSPNNFAVVPQDQDRDPEERLEHSNVNVESSGSNRYSLRWIERESRK